MSNSRDPSRGNTTDRARRRQFLLDRFGDGETAPCAFCAAPLTLDTVTADRIVPGREGGRYTRDNIRPACGPCNSADGAPHGGRRKAAAV